MLRPVTITFIVWHCLLYAELYCTLYSVVHWVYRVYSTVMYRKPGIVACFLCSLNLQLVISTAIFSPLPCYVYILLTESFLTCALLQNASSPLVAACTFNWMCPITHHFTWMFHNLYCSWLPIILPECFITCTVAGYPSFYLNVS